MNRFLNFLIGVTGALGAIIAYDAYTFDMTLPVERWESVEVLNSPIKPGESLEVIIRRKKVRDDCPVSSSRQAIDDNGKSYNLEDAVSMGGPLGDEVTFVYPTRQDMQVGGYTLRVFLTYTCPDFVWTTQQPDARFKVQN